MFSIKEAITRTQKCNESETWKTMGGSTSK